MNYVQYLRCVAALAACVYVALFLLSSARKKERDDDVVFVTYLCRLKLSRVLLNENAHLEDARSQNPVSAETIVMDTKLSCSHDCRGSR